MEHRPTFSFYLSEETVCPEVVVSGVSVWPAGGAVFMPTLQISCLHSQTHISVFDHWMPFIDLRSLPQFPVLTSSQTVWCETGSGLM